MSLYIGKDDSNKMIFHATRGYVSEDRMKSSSPIPETTYHSKGNYLEVEYHKAEIVDGNWIKFSLNTMYRMQGYVNGAYVKRPYLIIVNGKVSVRSVFNVWYPSKNGAAAYGVCGYNYNYPWIYSNDLVTSAYILIFSVDHSNGAIFPKPAASTCRISDNGIWFDGRMGIDQLVHLGSVMNSIDPIFKDSSNTDIQVINGHDYYTETLPSHPINIYSSGLGAFIEVNNKIILSPGSDMWKIPDGSVYTYDIPHDSCAIGSGWDYCLSTHSWESWLNQSYNIASIPTNVKSMLVTFKYQIFVKAGTTSWQYNFYMYNTFLISRGGTPVEVMYASTDPVSGPSGAMKLLFELNTSGVFRWFNIPYGSNLGGFNMDFYRATFTMIPVDFD